MTSPIFALVPIATGILAIALMLAIALADKSSATNPPKELEEEIQKDSKAKSRRDRFPGRRQGGGSRALGEDGDAPAERE